MNPYNLLKMDIESKLTMPDIYTFYCGGQISRGRAPCPLHHGKDRNMAMRQHYFKCFVCNASGDEISFVMLLFGLPFPEAMQKINRDFNLGYSFQQKISASERKAAESRLNAYLSERNERRRRIEQMKKAYHRALDDYARLDQMRMTHSPNSEAYAEAVKNMDRAEYFLDCAELRLLEGRKQLAADHPNIRRN